METDFLSAPQPLIRTYQATSDSSQCIEEDDLLAAKLMLGVFHLYCQWKEGDKSLDMTKPVNREYSLLRHTLSFHYPSVDLFSGWQFRPIEGHLGFYATLKFFGRPQRELFGVIGYHEASHTLAVIFRGSLLLSDYVFSNLNVGVKLPLSQRTGKSMRDWGILEGWHNQSFEGPIHAGYYNRIITCQDSLFSGLQAILHQFAQRRGSAPKLIITGHSLGGASAAIFTGALISDDVYHNDHPAVTENKLRVLRRQFSEIRLTSFGAPRVSDHTYGQWLKQQGVIVKNFEVEDDLVPLLPPYQLEGQLPFSAYARLTEPILLSSYGLSNTIAAHDPRLYWYAMAGKSNISPLIFPLFKFSVNSTSIQRWSGLNDLDKILNREPGSQ